jgi:hypothetical protein
MKLLDQGIFQRYFVEGRSQREIAEELQLPLRTVARHIREIRALLKPLQEEDASSRAAGKKDSKKGFATANQKARWSI